MRISNVGISCLPGRGHLYPVTALGRRLQSRGYRVTVFGRRITQSIVRDAGLAFRALPDSDGIIAAARSSGRARNGPDTLNLVARHATSVFQHLKKALVDAGIEAMLVDHADPAAGTVADVLGLSFVTIGTFPPIYLDDEVPPFICDWIPDDERDARDRNRRANALFARLVAPVLDVVNDQRRVWGLPEFDGVNDAFSKLAIITQLPAWLDFPRSHPPAHLFYTGPFSDMCGRRPVPFPWDRLTGQPLVYACLGTVRNTARHAYEIIAEACAALQVQLVVSLGGMALTPQDLGALAGNPLVVHYAPQDQLLQQASLAIIHGGLNSTLECICHGVPMVAIPITDDQPGMAARIRWQGLGVTLSYRRLTAAALRECISEVLTNPQYRRASARAQPLTTSGLDRAADIIDRVFDR